MAEDAYPPRRYRRLVRAVLWAFKQSEEESIGDAQLLEEIRASYRRLTDEGESDSELQAVGAFVLGSGLFVFGELRHIDEVLKHYPAVTSNAKYLVYAVRDLLTLPEGLDVLEEEDRRTIGRWAKENSDRLHWDEKKGVYVLE